MQITLNGQTHSAGDIPNVAALVRSLELKGRRVAVMVNEEIVKRERWDEIPIRDGDTVEVIQMVGGG